LLHKTAVDVREQLRSIFQEARLYPKILQKDNGGEFQGEVDEFLTERNIKYINTKSYSPQSNGLV
jgi:transposase InsO family protein